MLLFDNLIMSLFSYAVGVWAWCAYDGKYLSQMDRFCKRAFRYGYTAKFTPITDLMRFRIMGEGDHWQSLFSPWSVHGIYETGVTVTFCRLLGLKGLSDVFINKDVFLILFRFSIYMSYSSIYYYAIIVNSRMIVGISFNKDFIIIIIDTIVFSALSLSPPPPIVFSFHLGSGISQLTKHERKQRKLPGTQANGFVTCSFSTKDCGGLRDEPKERLRGC